MIFSSRRTALGLLGAWLVGCAGLTAMAQPRPAVAAPPEARLSPKAQALLKAEDDRFQAQVRRDVAAVDRGLAEELTYTHAVGRVQTKAEYLKALAGGRVPYRSIVAENRTAQVSGELGVTHGQLRMVVGDNTLTSSYLAAYVRRSGQWRLLYWQTSPAPPNEPAPAPGK